MPSQIKVDEIKNVAGQYEIKTNTFKGQTTGGSIAVQGEGTATTNLQQGLAKSWIHKNRFGSSIDDSFNISSMADTATGIFTVVFANNHNNIHYALTSTVIPEDNTTVISVCEINREADVAVSGYKAETAYANSGYNKTDYDYMACVTTHGDLA